MEYVGIVALIVAAYAVYTISKLPKTAVANVVQTPHVDAYTKKETDAAHAKTASEVAAEIEHVRTRAYELQERVTKLEARVVALESA